MVKRLPATVTVIYEAYCQKMGLEVQPINALVKLVGTSGSPIPYSGYLIATVKFPHIQNYEEDVVMLVIRDKTKWADSVPIQIGTRVITAVTEQIRPEDLQSIADTWKQTYMGNLMACAVKGHRDDGDNFSLDSVKGPVKLKKAVELEPLGQTEVWGYTVPFKERHRKFIQASMKMLGSTCRKCWTSEPSDPLTVQGAVQ